MPTRNGKIRVLALDGGGVRGLITLEVLAFLEQESGKRIADMFDLVCGTSTGGLLALGLCGRKGYSARAIAQIYMQSCPRIFARSAKQRLVSLGQLAGPKYDNKALYECAMAILDGKASLGDAKCPAMVTTYNIRDRAPKFYTTWDTPYVLMIDAAMSTTAAPTYFEPWNHNVDGGVCDNNPALSGVIEACRKFSCTVRDVMCVSLGTGSDMKAYDGEKARGWGVLSWAEALVSIFTDGTSELHAHHLRRLMQDADVFRLQCTVNGSEAELDNAAQSNLTRLHEIGVGLVTSNIKTLGRVLERLEG